jgi:hypothetical protein
MRCGRPCREGGWSNPDAGGPRRRVRAGARPGRGAGNMGQLPRGPPVAPRSGGRGGGIEPRFRPRGQGQRLRARRRPRLLDRQPRRSGARGVPRTRPDPAAPYGWRYRMVEWLGPASAISPLALPAVRIAVGDLLP